MSGRTLRYPPNYMTRSHARTAQQAREAQGEWILVCIKGTAEGARTLVGMIEKGLKPPYEPAGTFEAKYALGELDYEVHIRLA